MRLGLVHARIEVRELLRNLLAGVPGYELLWEAPSGKEALERNARSGADLVLLELPGPHDDAVETTRLLAASTPCAVLLMVSNGIGTHSARVFDALGHGAVDVASIPQSAAPEHGAPLLAKLRDIAGMLGYAREVLGAPPAGRTLVAIGASAGGPAAIAEILNALPANFPAAIVMVQHIDAQFTAAMSDWLAQGSKVPVHIARDGQAPENGVAVLAGHAEHLVLTPRQRFAYTPEPRHLTHRPSVDVLFDSIARRWRQRVIGVLLTGMGEDGARGLRALRDRGHHTIAQDAASSAIYGMPRAAVRLGAAVEVLPVGAIAGRLQQLLAIRETAT